MEIKCTVACMFNIDGYCTNKPDGITPSHTKCKKYICSLRCEGCNGN